MRKTAIYGLLIALLPATAAGYYYYTQRYSNFYEVIDGEFYRSGQMTADELRYYIEEYGIQTVINLRGTNPHKKWYREELKLAREMKISFSDMPLSARKALTPEQIDWFAYHLPRSPKPILVHCYSGADRSGMVSALYRMIRQNMPLEEAKQELSLDYGHLPIRSLPANDAMMTSLESLEESYQNVTVKLPDNIEMN